MKISLRTGIFYCLLFLAAFLAAIFLARNFQEGRRQNLILISVDTLRQDHLGIYGYPKNTTPHIDAFAKNAAVFTNAYTQTPSTYPSFAALMTGLSPFESGIYNTVIAHGSHYSNDVTMTADTGNLPLVGNTQTLAKVLKKNDYVTGAFILNHVLSPQFTGLDKGFDSYEMITDLSSQNPNKKAVESVLSFLDNNKRGKNPVFLWVHFLDPHSPYIPTDENKCRFNKAFCDEIKHVSREKLENNPADFRNCTEVPLDSETVDFYKTLYDGEIADIDNYIGTILKKITDLGMDKNSVVVFYSDHGESFEKNYYFAHSQQLYESSVKVPLIVYTPNNSMNGKTIDQKIRNTDLYATILGLLNLSSDKDDSESIDYSGLFGYSNTEKKEADGTPVFYMNVAATKFAARKGNYKYIFSTKTDVCNPDVKKELYDLAKDPQENKNTIESNRDVAAKLHNLLMEYLNRNPRKVVSKETQKELQAELLQDQEKQKIIDELKSLGY